MTPAHRVSPGSFVTASLGGIPTLCLKVERHGRDFINHYLIALDPLADRRGMGLVYLDPDQELAVVEGAALVLGELAAAFPDVGDVFSTPKGAYLKLRDEPKAQKVFAHVELATGLIRPRMDRQTQGVMSWTITR